MRKRLTDVIGWSECDGKKENLYSIANFTLECIRKDEEEYPNALSGAHDYLGREKAEVIVINTLGQIEDILEKYGIESLQFLDKILEQYKYLGDHQYSTMPKEDLDALFSELSRYKSAEERIGIDLVTIATALGDGIYVRYGQSIILIKPLVDLTGRCFYTEMQDVGSHWRYTYPFSERGRVWALTKEELK